jgi:hypothetical protein
MKNSGFKRKQPDPQAQLKEAYKLQKLAAKSVSRFGQNRKRINSRRKQYKGIKFDSTWEYECYLELERRLNAGEIENLDTHVLLRIDIKNESGAILRLTINIDFTYFDKVLNRKVRADAKPPKKLDGQKKDWFIRWNILRHLEPDYYYTIFRMHSTWRTIDI